MKLKFIIILSSVIVIGILLMPIPKYETYSSSNQPYKTDSVSIYEGKRLVLSICAHCHYNDEYGTLAGRKHGNPEKLGSFYSGNITKDSINGIGSWNEGELYYFFRTGIKPDGTYVFDMPKYPNLSEEDLASLIKFLKSDDALVKETPFKNPKPEYSILLKILLKIWLKPIKYDGIFVKNPDKNNMVEWGEYLSTAKFSCFDCHSGNAVTNNYKNPEKSWRFFKGKNPHVDEEGKLVFSSPLLPIEEKYSIEEFVNTVKTGYRPDGSILNDPMFPFAQLSDDELGAIYLYLKQLTKLK